MAIKAFTALTGLVPVQTGVWLHEPGVLGASPDGLVGDDAVLECKCPYTHRNETITEAVKHKDFYLECKNGHYALKTSNIYWDQVQGQLLAQRKYCYTLQNGQQWTLWSLRYNEMSLGNQTLTFSLTFIFINFFPRMWRENFELEDNDRLLLFNVITQY